jgi:hypothetical protein
MKKVAKEGISRYIADDKLSEWKSQGWQEVVETTTKEKPKAKDKAKSEE